MIETLIESLELEEVGKKVSGAVRNPGEGRSTAVTICCSVEVSFCTTKCPKCGRPLIDPRYMPTLEEWRLMPKEKRIESLIEAFELWKQEVRKEGRDWREMPLPTEEFSLDGPNIVEMAL
jgi:hypothetical protein